MNHVEFICMPCSYYSKMECEFRVKIEILIQPMLLKVYFFFKTEKIDSDITQSGSLLPVVEINSQWEMIL